MAEQLTPEEFEKKLEQKLEIETRVKDRVREKFDAKDREVSLVSLKSVSMKAKIWLWRLWIPLGAFGLLAGPGGMGKSTLAIWIAARITQGDLPGMLKGKPRSVIISATEDSFEEDIVPRLHAAGADLSRVFSINVSIKEKDGFLKIPEDLPKLAACVKEHEVALLILDPLTSRLSSRLDTHKDAEVRLALEPLAKLARETGATVLGLMHLNKGNGTDPTTRVIGSGAFANVGRFVMMVTRDEEAEEEENVYALGLPKGNHGPPVDLKFYQIEGVSIPDAVDEIGGLREISTSKITFTEKDDDRTFDDVFNAKPTKSDSDERDACRAYLVDYFVSRNVVTVPTIEIVKAATNAGHNAKTLRRAADDLKIERGGRGLSAAWTWTQASDRETGQKLTEPELAETEPGSEATARGGTNGPSNPRF